MKKRNKLTLISVIVIVGLITLIAIIPSHKKIKPTANHSPLLVELTPVTVMNIPITATATGNVVANEMTYISPKVAGYVDQILFADGQFVKAGTTLILLDDTK